MTVKYFDGAIHYIDYHSNELMFVKYIYIKLALFDFDNNQYEDNQ